MASYSALHYRQARAGIFLVRRSYPHTAFYTLAKGSRVNDYTGAGRHVPVHDQFVTLNSMDGDDFRDDAVIDEEEEDEAPEGTLDEEDVADEDEDEDDLLGAKGFHPLEEDEAM